MDLERQLDENHLKTKRLLNTVDVDVVSHEELRRRYALLADKLSIELGRTKELAQDLEAAQESVIKVS